MSRLSVYWPEETYSLVNNFDDHSIDERQILPFPLEATDPDLPPHPMDIITRARLLFSNRTCRGCSYPVVEPIELADAVTNRNGLAIPGTATLIGFRCCGCEAEWGV
jgi:hypothetical protein